MSNLLPGTINGRSNCVRRRYNTPESEKNRRSTLTISQKETKDVVKAMKNGRPPGPGCVPIDLIKYGRRTLIKRIKRLMEKCFTTNTIPKE